MQLLHQFETLLRGRSPRNRDLLDALAARHPMEFRTWAVAWICDGGHGPKAHRLLRILHQNQLLEDLLTNPAAMPLRDAIRVARLAQHSIAHFDRVVAETIGGGTEAQVKRALQLLQHLQLTDGVNPGLAKALFNRNERIRSLVSRLLGRLCDNRATIGALLNDRDARVRANAVEGLWGSNHPVALDLLQRALRDPNNRVAANAALGLFKIGDPSGIESLRRMSNHPHPRHRISAAWCIGQTADPDLCPLLEVLADDPVPRVREAAQSASSWLQRPEQEGSADLTVAVWQAYYSRGGGLQLRTYVADNDNNVLHLSADRFRICHGSNVLSRPRVRPPQERNDLITIFWMADESLPTETRNEAREAILDAMHYKRPRDLHCVVGATVRPALALSADLGQLAEALHQAAPDKPVLDWSGSLFRALQLAASRPACRTVLAFTGGAPLHGSVDTERLVKNAIQGKITVHSVVFADRAVAPEWFQIASATQGTYRAVRTQKELRDAFWRVFAELSSAYMLDVAVPPEIQSREFLLEVRSGSGYSKVPFNPVLLPDAM